MPQGLNHPGMSTAQQDNKPGAAFHHQGLVIEKPVSTNFPPSFSKKSVGDLLACGARGISPVVMMPSPRSTGPLSRQNSAPSASISARFQGAPIYSGTLSSRETYFSVKASGWA